MASVSNGQTVQTFCSLKLGDFIQSLSYKFAVLTAVRTGNSNYFINKAASLHADEVQPIMSRHLLKTLCTDMTNLAINCLAADQMMAVTDPNTLTHEVCISFEINSITVGRQYSTKHKKNKMWINLDLPVCNLSWAYFFFRQDSK